VRTLDIKDAVRRGQKARVMLAGPSGSGKTWTLLSIATVLSGGEPFLVIDTENESASLYSDRFKFKVVNWAPPYDPNELAEAIKSLQSQWPAIVIDSSSHFWMGEGGTLDIVDRAATKAKGNSYAGWKEGTPAQNALYEAMIRCQTHLLTGVRSKMDHVQEKDEKTGRTTVRKVGMAPIQRDGMEYEFTVAADMDMDHAMVITKTRCSQLSGQVFKAGKEVDMATRLKAWLDSAEPIAPPPPPPAVVTPEQAEQVRKVIAETGITKADALREVQRACGALVKSAAEIPAAKYLEVVAALEKAKVPA
jgi:hypothetical protein